MESRPTALGQFWAVALLTLREARRRKVFSVLLLFTVVVLSSATFFPVVDVEGRLRLIQLWSLRATLLFTVIVAVFVAGFSLPADMEQRRIYTLLSKPISKVTLFLGRLAGFSLLLGIFILVMAFVTIVYLRIASAVGGEGFPALKAEPRVYPVAFFTEGGIPHPDTPEYSYVFSPNAADALVYRFENLDPADFPEAAHGEFTGRVSSKVDAFTFAGPVVVTAGPVTLPPVDARTSTPAPFSFRPADVIGPDGSLEIRVRRGDPNLTVGAREGDLVLFLASELYEWNYLKGMTLVFSATVVILCVVLMSSTFMGAPMSILMGVFVFMVGQMHGFINDGIRDIDHSLQERDKALREDREAPPPPEHIPYWGLETSSALSKAALAVVGNFDKYDFSPYLIEDLALTAGDIGGALGDMALRVAVLILLGVLVMRSKEFS